MKKRKTIAARWELTQRCWQSGKTDLTVRLRSTMKSACLCLIAAARQWWIGRPVLRHTTILDHATVYRPCCWIGDLVPKNWVHLPTISTPCRCRQALLFAWVFIWLWLAIMASFACFMLVLLLSAWSPEKSMASWSGAQQNSTSCIIS